MWVPLPLFKGNALSPPPHLEMISPGITWAQHNTEEAAIQPLDVKHVYEYESL